jgi:hypothetical protein
MMPSLEMGSLIEPDQLPAGDRADDVVGDEVGVALPLQPTTLSITPMTEASRRFIDLPQVSERATSSFHQPRR